MNKIKALLIGILLSATALGNTDITVNDGQSAHNQYGNDPRGLYESGYVSEHSVAANKWDLKAFGFNQQTSELTFAGGFNPLTGQDGWVLGDIFFDLNGDWYRPARSNVNGFLQYSNPNFEYAIHFTGVSGSSLNYDVYALTAQSKVLTGWFKQNDEQDPYALFVDANSTKIGSGSTLVQTVTSQAFNALFNTDIGNNGNNFMATLNVGFLGQNQDFSSHLTLSCGNDNLVGLGATVPEPASAGVLAGVALLGLGLRRLKR